MVPAQVIRIHIFPTGGESSETQKKALETARQLELAHVAESAIRDKLDKHPGHGLGVKTNTLDG